MRQSQLISIAGAGPAGLTAAMTLAREGYEVVVHERQPDVGMRFYGDFQALENWTSDEDVLETIRQWGIQPTFYYRPIHHVSSYGSRCSAQVRFLQPLAYLIRRGCTSDSLDSALKRQALDLGVHLRFGSCLMDREADIVATGPRRAHAVAVGCVFETDPGECAAILLDEILAPKGYAYLLVADGRGTLATVLYDKFTQGKACLEGTKRRFHGLLGLQMRNVQHFGGYGTFDLPRSLTEGHRRYAGEAAGLQDYLFGFGIRHAMVSGYLAARSIIDGADYDQLCRKTIGPHLRTALINRYCYELFGQTGYDMLVYLSSKARDPRQFWTRVYTKPFFRMLAYPLALRATRRTQIR